MASKDDGKSAERRLTTQDRDADGRAVERRATALQREVEEMLRKQRHIYQRIAHTVENLKKSGEDKITKAALEIRMKRLDEHFAAFETNHELLISKYWDVEETQEIVRDDFAGMVEETYLARRITLAEMLESRQAAASLSTSGIASNSSPRTTLPRIQLPQFSGRYEDWPPFRDLFQSVIGRDASITDVERLNYLKTALKGEAEALVRNIPSIDHNY